jgi:hypothetical protein
MIDKKNPARDRLLAYYKKLKVSADPQSWIKLSSTARSTVFYRPLVWSFIQPFEWPDNDWLLCR